MRAFRRIVFTINLVFALATSLLIYWGFAGFPPALTDWVRDTVLAAQSSLGLFTAILVSCFVVVALNLFYIFAAARNAIRAGDRGLKIERPEGEVTVRASAIESVLCQDLDALTLIDWAKVRVAGGRRETSRTIITAIVRLAEAVDIPSTVRDIQATLKNRFEELLGPDRPVSINVIVSRLGKRPPGEPEHTRDEVIRPRYTVEEE
jgi:hypothetical protein